MTQAVFDLEFSGLKQRETTSGNPAVAHAVIGIDKMLTAASVELFGTLVEPEVDVRAAGAIGAYEVDLGFRIDAGKYACAKRDREARLTNPDPHWIPKALGFVPRDLADEPEADVPLGWCRGLVQLLLALNGRAIDRVFLTGKSVDIETGDDRYVVSLETYELLKNREVREGLEALAKSLTDPEICRVAVKARDTGEEILAFDAGAVVALSLNEQSEVLLVEEVRTMALRLAVPVYRTRDAWHFDDGLQKIEAQMNDSRVLAMIDSGIFMLDAGDVLVVNMRVRTMQSVGEGLVSTYEIIRVLDCRSAKRHLLMPGI